MSSLLAPELYLTGNYPAVMLMQLMLYSLDSTHERMPRTNTWVAWGHSLCLSSLFSPLYDGDTKCEGAGSEGIQMPTCHFLFFFFSHSCVPHTDGKMSRRWRVSHAVIHWSLCLHFLIQQTCISHRLGHYVCRKEGGGMYYSLRWRLAQSYFDLKWSFDLEKQSKPLSSSMFLEGKEGIDLHVCRHTVPFRKWHLEPHSNSIL